MAALIINSVLVASFIFISFAAGSFFDDQYDIIYGSTHIRVDEQQKLVELSLDQFSGGAAFLSKSAFGSGFFSTHMKIPDNRDSHAVLSTFYLSSADVAGSPPPDHHDELDFEFYGNDRLPIILQTNVFVNGHGNREQKIALWFDPRAEYHSYSILWNQWNTVFFVDDIPVRVFKNLTGIGQEYMTEPTRVWGSLWNASWAEHGIPISWDQAPFKCSYKDLNIQGCRVTAPEMMHYCNSRGRYNWWNDFRYRQLDATQQAKYKTVQEKYIVYDYCYDKSRYPTPPVECSYNK